MSITSEERTAEWVHQLVATEGSFESPIDINLARAVPLDLPPLSWHNNELPPKKMKLTNTGHTLILSAKWHQERPFLSEGPLLGKYVFSQLHFHWGGNDMEGSEHTVDGTRHPLEMHVVHFKSCYLTQEAALKEKDGIVVLSYFFMLQNAPNPSVQILVDAIPYIVKPHCSVRLDPLPLCFLLKPFQDDYFLYWGSVTTSTCIHLILWLLSREPIGISSSQVEVFRSLLDTNEQPLIRNFRTIQPTNNRKVFHVCPSPSQYSTLLPLPRTFVEENNHHRSVRSDSKQSYQSEMVYRVDKIRCTSPFVGNKCEARVQSAKRTHERDVSERRKPGDDGGGGEANKGGESKKEDKGRKERRKKSDSRTKHRNS